MSHSIEESGAARCCGGGHVHAEWPMEAEILLDGEHYAEIRSVADGKAWIAGREGAWSVVPRNPCSAGV